MTMENPFGSNSGKFECRTKSPLVFRCTTIPVRLRSIRLIFVDTFRINKSKLRAVGGQSEEQGVLFPRQSRLALYPNEAVSGPRLTLDPEVMALLLGKDARDRLILSFSLNSHPFPLFVIGKEGLLMRSLRPLFVVLSPESGELGTPFFRVVRKL